MNYRLVRKVHDGLNQRKRFLMMTSLTARKILAEHLWFGNLNRINSGNVFHATTLNLAEKFDDPILNLVIFGNIFVKGHSFHAVTVKRSQYFGSLF